MMNCVHGRFQPFHLGHFDYFKQALKLGENLIVGLTAVTPPSQSHEGVEHRSTGFANPLCYLERVLMIEKALDSEGVDLQKIRFVPFPIDEPENLKYILPTSVLCLTTNLYEWNEEKIKRLKSVGYQTKVLENCGTVAVNGQSIRDLICDNQSSWRTMVLPAVAEFLDEISFRERLLKLR
jgi:cytidyltransferase-like protein